MASFLHQLTLVTPLFSLILVGYATMCLSGWPATVSDALTRFVFAFALPAMLFRLMSDSAKLPAVDWRLLLAYFGGCLIVFVIGRLIAWKLFGLDGEAQSVFALGGIFSNIVMLGLPFAKLLLGEKALAPAALVIVFNSLTLWTLVSVSVEWAKHGSFSVKGFASTLRGVLTNPIVAGILSGSLYSLTGWPLPVAVDTPLGLLAQSATPLALVALGMGLAEHSVREGWRLSIVISVLKLLVQPLVVWLLACLLGLPKLETQVVVLVASVATGVNVYLMSRHFKTLEGPTASALVLSTLFAVVTTPLALTLVG